ncbi:MAG: RNA 2',3'-cyclic phosphodiesterase [Ilumatobacteraceae bacterium]
MSRLFFAVWPPDEVVDALTELRRKDQRGVRFVPPENWHITLRFLGEAEPGRVLHAMDRWRCAPAQVTLGPAVDVLADRLLVIPASGLDVVADEVTKRTRTIGERPRRRFVGHLTVARFRPDAALPSTLGARFDATFDADEIALVQSRLEPDGARYETLETWPLDAPRR